MQNHKLLIMPPTGMGMSFASFAHWSQHAPWAKKEAFYLAKLPKVVIL